jgi:hypothetical protein
MTPEQRKHFEFVRDEMHGEPKQEQNKPLAWKHYTDPLERRLEHLQSKAHQNSFDKHEASALKHVLEIVKQSQQRTWVGLTDEDLAVCGDEDDVMLARYWERVCKEKNT